MGNTTRNLEVPGKRGQLLTVKGPCWKQSFGESMFVDMWEHSNDLQCLSLWRAELPHSTWGEHVGDSALQWNMHDGSEDWNSELCWAQRLQPYVHVKSYYDSPFPQAHDTPTFDIDTGVDPDFSSALEPGRIMSVGKGYGLENGEDITHEEAVVGSQPEHNRLVGSDWKQVQVDTSDPKRTQDSSAAPHESTTTPSSEEDAEGILGAPPLWRTERLGQPRLAASGTLGCPQQHQQHADEAPPLGPSCAFLGGGKRGRDDEAWLDEGDDMVEQTIPGRLQNRLLVLQERATEAIKALPVACREDWEYGMVETRVWGLEALRHVLRMRLDLQSTLMLCKPVGHEPENPPSVELLAATLTLNIHNKGNR